MKAVERSAACNLNALDKCLFLKRCVVVVFDQRLIISENGVYLMDGTMIDCFP